ncbi:MAG: SDR family oxidoreductase [Bacteroidota bacterium]
MDISAKIAVITGASSGLGAAFSKALIDKGATVYGLARSTDKLEKLNQRWGDEFIPVTMDITDSESIESWVTDTFSDQHQPDILINNAGLGLFGPVDELSLDAWQTMVNTNLNGVFYLTRQLVPLMKQNSNTCHIVNIASIAGKIGNPNLTGYNATKFGVGGFSEALFKELRYDKIKVTCLYPGSISTKFFDNVDMETHDHMMRPKDMADVLVHLLETPDNFLINEMTMRPLNPKPPEE